MASGTLSVGCLSVCTCYLRWYSSTIYLLGRGNINLRTENNLQRIIFEIHKPLAGGSNPAAANFLVCKFINLTYNTQMKRKFCGKETDLAEMLTFLLTNFSPL